MKQRRSPTPEDLHVGTSSSSSVITSLVSVLLNLKKLLSVHTYAHDSTYKEYNSCSKNGTV